MLSLADPVLDAAYLFAGGHQERHLLAQLTIHRQLIAGRRSDLLLLCFTAARRDRRNLVVVMHGSPGASGR